MGHDRMFIKIIITTGFKSLHGLATNVVQIITISQSPYELQVKACHKARFVVVGYMDPCSIQA